MSLGTKGFKTKKISYQQQEARMDPWFHFVFMPNSDQMSQQNLIMAIQFNPVSFLWHQITKTVASRCFIKTSR